MATATYPTGVRIFIDGVDCTTWIFNAATITLDDLNKEFENIDITTYLKGHGEATHTIEVTCDAGVGRVEARVEME